MGLSWRRHVDDRPTFYEVATAQGTDKVPGNHKNKHQYQWMYDKVLPAFRDKNPKMLEIGLGCDMVSQRAAGPARGSTDGPFSHRPTAPGSPITPGWRTSPRSNSTSSSSTASAWRSGRPTCRTPP